MKMKSTLITMMVIVGFIALIITARKAAATRNEIEGLF